VGNNSVQVVHTFGQLYSFAEHGGGGRASLDSIAAALQTLEDEGGLLPVQPVPPTHPPPTPQPLAAAMQISTLPDTQAPPENAHTHANTTHTPHTTATPLHPPEHTHAHTHTDTHTQTHTHTYHDGHASLCTSCMNKSCLIYEWAMSHVWMSHVSYMNE